MDAAAESLLQQTIVNGQKYQQKRCPMVLGISIGNSHYFKQDSLERLFSMAETNSDKILIFIPVNIYEHSFKAVGLKDPKKIAQKQAIRLRNKCERVMQKIGCSEIKYSFVRWKEEVEYCPAYLEALQYIKNIYRRNDEFRCDVQESTKAVLLNIKKGNINQDKMAQQRNLTEGIDLEEGVIFLLKELAFFDAIPKIYMNFDEFVDVYHRIWPIAERYFSGYYDGIVKPSYGFALF